MTTVYVPWKVTGPDGEVFELELAVEVSADGDVVGLTCPSARVLHVLGICGATQEYQFGNEVLHDWALRQIDMGDLAEDALRALQARARGWP